MLGPVSYEDKVEIMDSDIDFNEKLNLLSLEKEFSSIERVKWSFEPKLNASKDNSARHLADFYDAFGLNTKVLDDLQKVKTTYFDYNIEIVLPFGLKISIPSKDRKVVGFYNKAGVLILQRRHPANGIYYESVSSVNPNSPFEGVPLIENKNERYFADLRMLFKSDGVDFVIEFWKRNNGSFISLGKTVIPFNNYLNSRNRSEIVNMMWENSTFRFDIIEHDNSGKSSATTASVEFF
jgi:hypothetical protein